MGQGLPDRLAPPRRLPLMVSQVQGRLRIVLEMSRSPYLADDGAEMYI